MGVGGRQPPGSAGPARDVVFVSYSHRDREWLRRLLVLLGPVVRNRRLEVWADEYIPVGEDWQRAIDGAVDRAALGLLLVSGDFLASRFIIEVELPALLERRVRLAPVLVHDCLWEHEPLLDRVHWAHDHARDGPLDLDAAREGERDRRLVQICRKVVALLPAEASDASRPAPRSFRRPAQYLESAAGPPGDPTAGHAADHFALERPAATWELREAVGEFLETHTEPARVGSVEAGPGAGRLDGGPPPPPRDPPPGEVGGVVAGPSAAGRGAGGGAGDTAGGGLPGP